MCISIWLYVWIFHQSLLFVIHCIFLTTGLQVAVGCLGVALIIACGIIAILCHKYKPWAKIKCLGLEDGQAPGADVGSPSSDRNESTKSPSPSRAKENGTSTKDHIPMSVPGTRTQNGYKSVPERDPDLNTPVADETNFLRLQCK